MSSHADIASSLLILGLPLALSACVNTRVYSAEQLSAVARDCGVAQGEVVQEPDEPRFLFLYAIGPTGEELACVRRWSRRRNMHLAWIEAVDWTDQ